MYDSLLRVCVQMVFRKTHKLSTWKEEKDGEKRYTSQLARRLSPEMAGKMSVTKASICVPSNPFERKTREEMLGEDSRKHGEFLFRATVMRMN